MSGALGMRPNSAIWAFILAHIRGTCVATRPLSYRRLGGMGCAGVLRINGETKAAPVPAV